ncbi:MAG TPA: M48 family metalloprotease [Gemmatimonadaceae bacterium]|nr:M48 family metalloprotease [Gemmatimonadaceae bacterium]
MWSGDYQLPSGEWFGDWLHALVAENAFIEQSGSMPDRVRAAATRLQAHRPATERFTVEVPWLHEFTAFTAPGRFIYFSRRLLERCPHEEAAAFVIAHELAHHELGHLDFFRYTFARRAARLSGPHLAMLFFRSLQKRIYSVERETAADRHAMDLCLRAGYDPGKCLYLFHILELIALDFGDVNAVFGLDPESDRELDPDASAILKARIWLYQQQRGYLPIQDRLGALLRYLEERKIQVRLQGA